MASCMFKGVRAGASKQAISHKAQPSGHVLGQLSTLLDLFVTVTERFGWLCFQKPCTSLMFSHVAPPINKDVLGGPSDLDVLLGYGIRTRQLDKEQTGRN